MFKKLLGVLVLATLLGGTAPGWAQSPVPTPASTPKGDALTKDALLAAWQQEQRQNPETKLFEKTDDPSVYNFESTLLPYKGRVKVLNVLVEKMSDPYSDYDNREGITHKGDIEIDLLDAPPDFDKKYPASLSAWRETNRFFYDEKTEEWFPENGWQDHFAKNKSVPDNYPAPPRDNGFGKKQLTDLAIGWGPLFLFLIFVIVFARRQNKRVWKNQAEVMERQKQSIQLAEEGMAIQREHTQILRGILDALNRK